MARVLVLSSQVAVGHVGLSAAQPVLQALGHQVTGLPTVMLSNHLGFETHGAHDLDPRKIEAVLAGIVGNGWLADHDAVLIGYLPTPEFVDLAVALIEQSRAARPDIRVIVDPVLGDHPKGLYIAADTAEAIRTRLVARADCLTPNRFEAAWLTGQPVEDLRTARHCAQTLHDRTGAEVFVTSAPTGPGQTGVLGMGHTARLWRHPLRAAVPAGVGDTFSALLAAGVPAGAALGHLDALVAASLGQPHLAIVQTQDTWRAAAPLPEESLPDGL